jgi:DNA-binding response OmpR family regulator
LSKVLVIHHDKAARSVLETAAKHRHEVASSGSLSTALKYAVQHRPHVIIVGHDREKQHGTRLLKYMRDNIMKVPVVVAFSKGRGHDQQALVKLGAKVFVDLPIDSEKLEVAIRHAVKIRANIDVAAPPITEEELKSNLSLLERDLNKHMKCFAGRNQVYIQATILGGRTTKPRIALKCGLRAEYGLNRDVYLEWIRNVCCGDPNQCEAYQEFMANRDV